MTFHWQRKFLWLRQFQCLWFRWWQFWWRWQQKQWGQFWWWEISIAGAISMVGETLMTDTLMACDDSWGGSYKWRFLAKGADSEHWTSHFCNWWTILLLVWWQHKQGSDKCHQCQVRILVITQLKILLWTSDSECRWWQMISLEDNFVLTEQMVTIMVKCRW